MGTVPSNLQQVNILGVQISAITMSQALAHISNWIENREKQYISVCTVHTVMECQGNDSMRQAVNGAGLATPDGMPLVWLGQWRGKAQVDRVYGPDLMLNLCQASIERGYTHFFYGGASGVPESLASTLQSRYPGLQIAGTYSPPYRALADDERDQIITQINNCAPDIVWVGLGTPKQDLWMYHHRPDLAASVLIGVGAAFDFHTNRIAQAPAWMQRRGLEWLFRLWQEPGRLWYRYLIFNPLFILLTLAQILGLKRYPIE